MRGFNLEGKVGIVTGGCAGIGRAIVETLAEEGATVIAFDLNTENAPAAAAMTLQVDVTSEPAVAEAFSKVHQHFGKLDFCVNNAGIDIETAWSEEWRPEPLDKTLDVDLKGVFHCMRHAVSFMRPQKSGAIVNIGSVAALVGVPIRPAYTASKHAVIGLTRTAALQFGPDNIRTNVVCPGGTVTAILEQGMADDPEFREKVISSCPMRRLADPSEIADAVLWLVSPRSSYVNGAVIAVDAGYTAG